MIKIKQEGYEAELKQIEKNNNTEGETKQQILKRQTLVLEEGIHFTEFPTPIKSTVRKENSSGRKEGKVCRLKER